MLFDFGHTLFDTVDSGPHSVEFAAHRGLVIDATQVAGLWADVRAASRTPDELAKGRDLSGEAHRRCWLDLLTPFDSLVPGLAEELYGFESGVRGWQLYPDARPTLDALVAAGIRIGLVSDTGWDLRPLFTDAGIANAIEAWVLSFEHGAAKPAPRLFRAACSELGVSPEATLMVGDNHLTDGGAVAAGLNALVLPAVPTGAARGLDVVLTLVGIG